jgi:hypothetical protein
MRNVTVTLVVGIALLALVGAVTLTRSPPRVLRVAGRPETVVAHLAGDIAFCQGNEVLPAGVSAIRLSTWAFLGYDVHVRLYRGTRVLAEGHRGANWTSDSVTIPVRALPYASPEVTLCFSIGPNTEPVIILGTLEPTRQAAILLRGPALTPAATTNEALPGRVAVEYVAAGRGSWWSRAGSVAAHMGLGRAFSGTWITFLIFALMLAVGALAVRLTWRELP